MQSRFEIRASTALRGKGYEEWLPLYRARRQWSDRAQQVDLPLFPGYLFCRLDVQGRLLPVLKTPGVIAIVSAGKTPIPVPDDEIAAVQTVLRSGLPAQPGPDLAVGSKVFVQRGPLAGIEGIVVSLRKIYTLAVSIQLLQRTVAVEIERDWVRPIADAIGSRVAPLGEFRGLSKNLA